MHLALRQGPKPEKKSCQINLRLSPGEKAALVLRAQRAGKTLSAYMIAAALRARK